jgi:hypothetical protein
VLGCRKAEQAKGILGLSCVLNLVASHACKFFIELMRLSKVKTLNLGLRWDEVSKIIGLKIVIPAQAGVEHLSLCTH